MYVPNIRNICTQTPGCFLEAQPIHEKKERNFNPSNIESPINPLLFRSLKWPEAWMFSLIMGCTGKSITCFPFSGLATVFFLFDFPRMPQWELTVGYGTTKPFRTSVRLAKGILKRTWSYISCLQNTLTLEKVIYLSKWGVERLAEQAIFINKTVRLH